MEAKTLVEIGGGGHPSKKKDGFINVDLLPVNEFVDISCDVSCERLPFDDKSVSEIYCKHCLEHIVDVKHFLNECHRVLDGKVNFFVPYGLWAGSFKPVHVQYITECWFDFLRKENSERVYGYKRWNIARMDYHKSNKGEIYELDVDLIPIK